MKKRYGTRWLCTALTILLLLPALPVAASAQEDAAQPAFRVGVVDAHPGEDIEIAVSAADNPGIISAMLRLSYDPDVLTLTGIENGTVFDTSCFQFGGDLSAVPYTFYWLDALRTDNNIQNGTLATLAFRVADDASAGETSVSITYDAVSTMDVQMNPVAFTVVNGGVNVRVPQTVTLDPNGGVCAVPAITVYCGEPYGVLPVPARDGFAFDGWFLPDGTLVTESTVCTAQSDHTLTAHWTAQTVSITAKDGSTAVIDDERGFIYGLDFNRTVNDLTADYLNVIGSGHLEYSTLAAGTGTFVYVVNDSSGNIDATYELVIFGDLDGDGMMGSNDVTQMRAISAQVVVHPEGSAKRLAADVNHDGLVNSSDHTLIRSTAAHLSQIAQSF